MTGYVTKYRSIKKFVKLNINPNQKNFTTSQKALITKYYNKLNAQGYFNREQEGYVIKDISRTKYKVKGSPKLKNIYVNVGTKIVNGKVVTDTANKPFIRNKKLYVKIPNVGNSWRFQYDIKKDWKLEDFKKHLLKRMGQKNIKEGQVFVVGAGLYEVAGTQDQKLEGVARDILQLANKYNNSNAIFDRTGNGKYKDYEAFLTEVVVYDSIEVLKALKTNKKTKKRRKTKYEKMKGR